MSRADEIETAVLVIHGEKAHSRYFGEDAFKKLQGDNKGTNDYPPMQIIPTFTTIYQ